MVPGLVLGEQHVYRYNGRVVTNVTRVIDATLRNLTGVNPLVLANKREIGELVHRATELDAMGELDIDSVDESIAQYMKGWRRFRDECRPVFHSNEEHVYHPTYDYAGTLDHCMTIGADEGIVDKKTSEPDLTDAVQLSAYFQAKYRERPAGKGGLVMWALHLRDDGTYRLRKYSDHFHVFIAALTCYRFKNGRE